MQSRPKKGTRVETAMRPLVLSPFEEAVTEAVVALDGVGEREGLLEFDGAEETGVPVGREDRPLGQ